MIDTQNDMPSDLKYTAKSMMVRRKYNQTVITNLTTTPGSHLKTQLGFLALTASRNLYLLLLLILSFLLLVKYTYTYTYTYTNT